MNYDDVIQLTTQGLVLVLVISLPITMVAATVGLMVSFVQAVTSLQDQSVSQCVKLVVVTLTLFLAAPWAGSMLLGYARQAILGAGG